MRLRAILVVIAIVACIGVAFWWSAKKPAEQDGAFKLRADVPSESSSSDANADGSTTPPSNRPIEVHADGFLGSNACRECHAEQYGSWHASYHRRMTQVATPDSVIGKFDTSNPIRAYEREFLLSRRGNEFWVTMDNLEAETATEEKNVAEPSKVERKIVMTTGSHHMQIYWYTDDAENENGRTLWQLPVAWLNETKSWVPTSSLFISPPPQPLRLGKRRWNEVCIKCHTTNGQPRIDRENGIQVDTHVAEFGISCEACHGPGEEHIAYHAAFNSDNSNGPTDGIVHPAKLDHKRSSQVCGQCHGNWLPSDEQGLHEFYVRGTCFRAGDDLADKRHIFAAQQPRSEFIKTFLSNEPHYFEDRYWKDGSIRVSGGEYNGMTNSPCFEASDMSCLSCHQMHQPESDPRDSLEWANDQLKHEAIGQEACLQCHEDFRSESHQAAHSHHPIGSAGNECYNCHMPHTSYGLLKAIRSHRISVPSVQESTKLGRPNACNQCHVDRTLAWTGKHLQDWYNISAPKDLTEDQKQYSATALWALTGDAGQRALAAWSLGWKPAQEASRSDWIPPVLAQLLADPYDAVRHIAHRSLRVQPGFENFRFDYVAGQQQRQQAAVEAFRIWGSGKRETDRGAPSNSNVLLSPSGKLLNKEFSRLNHQRDNRQILLAE